MKAVGQHKPQQSRNVAAATSTAAGRKRKGGVSPPTTVELRGVSIHFPFRPYKCQEAYMGKVLDALLRSENALLESPTGTGKTLCLLCATLAWQREQAKMLGDKLSTQNQQQPSTNSSLLNGDNVTGSEPTQPSVNSHRVPTIIYASRTHSQLSQVVRELKNTRYRPKHAVLGSREQMCVHPKVKKSADTSSFDINHGCNVLSKERKCRYRNALEGFTAPSQGYDDSNTQPVLDMEDLVSMGKKHKVCPFYYTRSLVADAELVLMPYNYLFDKDARETTLQDIAWDNAIVIFDEAHNLESFATESASFDITQTDIAICVAELQRVLNYMSMSGDEDGHSVKMENVTRLKALFLNLESYLIELPYSGAQSGELMMEIFTKGMAVNYGNHHLFVDEVKKVCEVLLDIRGGGGGGAGSNKGQPKLDTFVRCVKQVFGETTEAKCFAKAKQYRVHITPKGGAGVQQQHGANSGGRNSNNSNNKPNANSRTLSYWCFAPSLAMQELSGLKIRSILVTSGTLSPLPSYSMELGLSFPHTLENPHIISEDQIHVRVIGKGVSGKELTSSYQRRQDGDYYIELGNTLVTLAKVIPAGMLVFFPSYSVMETCLERWGCPAYYNHSSNKGQKNKATSSFFAARNKKGRNASNRPQYSFPFNAPSIYGSALGSAANPNTPWKRLVGTKSVVVEPRSTADLPDAIAEFHKYLDMPKSKGVFLFGICRGKISEGIDFSGDQSRAVVITGLPFPPAFDPKVKLKREYLDGIRASKSIKSDEAGGFGGGSAAMDGNGKAQDSAKINTQTLSGHEWYSQQAHRAVNQAVGRVIRNRHDYGAVLLLDSRYSQPGNQQGLSKWVRSHVLPDQGVGTAIGGLVKFYKQAGAKAKERDEANKGLVLEYEQEEEAGSKRQKQPLANAEDNFTKVAFVQNLNRDLKPPAKANLKSVEGSAAAIDEDEENPVSYIAPDKVLARVDLGTIVQKKEPVFGGSFKRSNDAPSSSNGGTESKAQARPDKGQAVANSSAYASLSTNRPSKAPIKPNPDSSKQAAAQFFKKAQKWFTSSEFSAVRKAIVAMKQHGDKQNVKAYLTAAREIIILCCNRERFFGEHEKEHGETMLFLFFQVIPASRRMDVQLLAMKQLFKKTALGQLCKENFSPEQYKKNLSALPLFLRLLWCGKNEAGDTLTDKTEFLKEAQRILPLLSDSNSIVPSTLAASFAKLIPSRFSSAAQALLSEMEATRNIKRMKTKEEQVKGEDAIDTRRFQRPSQPLAFSSRQDPGAALVKKELGSNVPLDRKPIASDSSQIAGKERNPNQPQQQHPAKPPTKSGTVQAPSQSSSNATSARQKDPPGGPASSTSSAPSARPKGPPGVPAGPTSSQTKRVNPYAKKPKTLSAYIKSNDETKPEARKPAQAQTNLPNRAAPSYARKSELTKAGKPLPNKQAILKASSDPVDNMLQRAEAQPYVKKTTGDIVNSLKSNAPSNMHCGVCSKAADTPMMGDCGHLACKACWLQWLKRSETCPFCKASVKADSLSRLVFQDKPGSKGQVPTMSQLCD